MAVTARTDGATLLAPSFFLLTTNTTGLSTRIDENLIVWKEGNKRKSKKSQQKLLEKTKKNFRDLNSICSHCIWKTNQTIFTAHQLIWEIIKFSPISRQFSSGKIFFPCCDRSTKCADWLQMWIVDWNMVNGLNKGILVVCLMWSGESSLHKGCCWWLTFRPPEG